MEITYDSIKPYILEENFDNANLVCKFKVEGEIFEEKGYVKVDYKDGTHNVKNMVRNTLLGRMRTALSQFLYKVTGGGLVGNIATMTTNEAVRNNVSSTSYSRKDKEAAVVACFQKLTLVNLYYNEEERAWRIARKFSEFEIRLKKFPIDKPYDKKTLARMLMEMSRADGTIEAEEKEFIEGFLSTETGTLAELMRKPPISKVECEEVTKDAKENVFMVVAAMAMSDHEFEDTEKAKLATYGDMMGFTTEKQSELMRYAQDYTIEFLIREGKELSREEIYAFADKIGMDRGEAERAQIKYSKRVNN